MCMNKADFLSMGGIKGMSKSFESKNESLDFGAGGSSHTAGRSGGAVD